VNTAELLERFQQIYNRPPAIHSRAPGRVNLLGEHVDYNQGLALPCGIQLAAEVALAPSGSDRFHVKALDLDAEFSFSLGELQESAEHLRSMTPEWARYPVGVCWAWARSGHRLTGWDAVYTCSVPSGSGLSSSAAIEVAFASALSRTMKVDLEGLELARLGQAAEHAVAGVQSGLMDQWTSACAVKDHALLLDFQAFEAKSIPLPSGVSIVVADSGVRRDLAGSAYNQRVEECQQATSELQGLLAYVHSLRDVPLETFRGVAGRLSEPARRRAQHVVDEIERVREGTTYLQQGDLAGFGALMRASHTSLRDLYEVSVPEMDQMVDIADSLEGGYGSRLTGFGGSIVCLVEAANSERFCRLLSQRYASVTGKQAELWVCHAGDGAISQAV
jgi:galactokinase